MIVDIFPHSKWKFDPDNFVNRELGSDGEKFVISELHAGVDADLHGFIKQVSLFDDSLGYDIESPSTINSENQVFLEVKSSARVGKHVDFYITKNEAMTGASKPNWFLVFVRFVMGTPKILGYLPYSEIAKQLPIDRTEDFKWVSSRGQIEQADLIPGLP